MSENKTEVKLVQSPVVFNEEAHTYSLEGKELSGITSILKRYIFPDMYSCVNQAVLDEAAKRGTIVHNAIRMWVKGILHEENMEEYRAFFCSYNEAGLSALESEYLVSDNESVASSIDLVCVEPETNKIILCDIKTTSTLHMEYLQWQLSIYAYLFEHQNPELKVSGLRGIHIRDGKCKIVEVVRLRDEYVESLLDTFRNDQPLFINPLRAIPEGMDELIHAYALNEADIAYCKQVASGYEARRKELQEKMGELLKEKGITKLDTEMASINVLPDTERTSFDFKNFRESEAYTKDPATYEAFIKTTHVRGGVRVTVK